MGSIRCRSEVKKGEIFGILQESESELTIKECGHEDTSYIKKNPLFCSRPPKMNITNKF